MSRRIEVSEVSIAIPPGLVADFRKLVFDYSAQHREPPLDCLRAVEIAIVQRGMRAMREEMKENRKLGERMGWAKEEEIGT